MRAILLLPALLAMPAAAQDVQNWTSLIAQGPVGGQVVVWGELQSRFDQDLSRFAVGIVRVGVGVRLKHDVDLMAGYHFQHNELDGGRTRDEHRGWQQVQAPLLRRANGFTLITRWRLEERSIVGSGDLGWRLRGQLRLVQPLHGRGTGGPLLQSETFVSLNSTDWGARAGLDSQRTLIGWLQPLSPRLNLEAGYMHVLLNRAGGDQGNHIISITLNRRLG
ncbi:hypothetical protein CAP39_04440 [Sphingomonas sp. IBVSS1]|nr:hypothetical protein CAP39_04440 [Sphingomonas sp. IBVSS1]